MRSIDQGFTLVELMVVVLIIGILVGVAIPVYQQARGMSELRTCFANQRTLEGCVQQYVAKYGESEAVLAGAVNDSHPLVHEYILRVPPHCPAGDEPADPGNPTAAEGAYTFDANGSIVACSLGRSGPHGHY